MKSVMLGGSKESSLSDQERSQEIIRCKAKIYKLNMQRCPYIHEMKERLLGEQISLEPPPKIVPAQSNNKMESSPTPTQQQPVATIVRLNADGYGSPTHHVADRTPLMPRDIVEDLSCPDESHYPKNAKTSLFIIMSFVYAKLLIVVCIAYVISDVVTHNIPLYYYEGFFTYLYGMSILFLLYVFCFLLQESTCCSGTEKNEPPKKLTKDKTKEKEKEKKKEEEKKKKEEKEKKEKEKKEKAKEKDKDKKPKKQEKMEIYPRKKRDLVHQKSISSFCEGTYRRNSEGVVDSGLPVPVTELSVQNDVPVVSQEQTAPVSQPPVPPPQPQLPTAPLAVTPVPPASVDLELGTVAKCKRKRKTTQNDHSHGSFFLRIGAIAFGLATMIYNGLEFGTFFEIPFTSPCYMILKGVNPVLQMIFTFMQMYFIFMNSRLNIHRFKVIARFGLMHVVATNICVWIRTLVLEYIKEVTLYHQKVFNATLPSGYSPIAESIRLHTMRNANSVLGTHVVQPDKVFPTLSALATSSDATTPTVSSYLWNTIRTAATTLRSVPTTLPTTTTRMAEDSRSSLNVSERLDSLFPQALVAFNSTTNASENSCGRLNIMGTIVNDSAPYLFPFIIEYSLIGAAVIYVMWKHIGRNPKYVTEEDLEHRLEIMLSRRAAALAHAQQHGRVDCVGASKGLFFGLLLLVGSLICLILFFVLIHQERFSLLAIYLADVSHCALMALSIIAIIIGFIRVQSLKFKAEEQTDLNDILLRVSAFGLFLYAVFSIIAGHLNAFTKEPNMLVMITGCLSVVQVVLQLLFIADVSRRRVHLPEHDRSKPGRQVVTFLLICNVTMWIIYTFEIQKVEANPVQLEFYGFLAWAIVQRFTLPLCIFHRFHSAVTLAEIWKTSYKARLE
ncbi:proton channel OtopLc isoform X8 [Coccinella septempunctata]|uniref:proton channel OtopLc isoform X8 n=1 Tax=Coccinella septempunctata TaxID=41139 RepID=UPI001D084966|nr:proton channel OtopLc isoform X8 [Coccinella septempunctata]